MLWESCCRDGVAGDSSWIKNAGTLRCNCFPLGCAVGESPVNKKAEKSAVYRTEFCLSGWSWALGRCWARLWAWSKLGADHLFEVLSLARSSVPSRRDIVELFCAPGDDVSLCFSSEWVDVWNPPRHDFVCHGTETQEFTNSLFS